MAMHRWWKWEYNIGSCLHIFYLTSLFLLVINTNVKAETIIEGAVYAGDGVLSVKDSPFLVKNDIVVEETGKLRIEPGCTLRFSPGVGITVRGTLIAMGNEHNKIILTKKVEDISSDIFEASKQIRFVDGPSIIAGRLQIYYNSKWRSVCTNSRNWTNDDFRVACNQLGFQGGQFFKWYERNNDSFQMLYEKPACSGKENNLVNCNASKVKLGSGVCEDHFDIGIQCLQSPSKFQNIHWRGVQFESFKPYVFLDEETKTKQIRSLSYLSHVDILYAGYNRTGNVTSALNIIGIPPFIDYVNIKWSAYNGINVTKTESDLDIKYSSVQKSKGYGIFINSSSGMANIMNCTILNNGGDGLKYVHHDLLIPPAEAFDLCGASLQSDQQYYPIRLLMNEPNKSCQKRFSVQDTNQKGLVLTVHFVYWWSKIDNAASVEIRDGQNSGYPLLISFNVANATRPQSITTTGRHIWIQVNAIKNSNFFIMFDIVANIGKPADLTVSNSIIKENSGRGIVMENIRNMLIVNNSVIQHNNYIAGIQVINGSGDVNVSYSDISSNVGDGINISYAGGNRNVTKCIIKGNEGRGIAVSFNQSSSYLFYNQKTIIAYSNIFENIDTGIIIGNFCGNSLINITESSVVGNRNIGLHILSCWIPGKETTQLNITLNSFSHNRLTGFLMKPAVSMTADISHNTFEEHSLSALVIQNENKEELEILPAKLMVYRNVFTNNKGWLVANLGLSQYSLIQTLDFTFNRLISNKISEPFPNHVPRSRAAAVVVVSSNNTKVNFNSFENPQSKYDMASWLENSFSVINGSYNWFGKDDFNYSYYRVFDANFRYNIAKIKFMPILRSGNVLDMSDISEEREKSIPFRNNFTLGGMIKGQYNDILEQGIYEVIHDLIIQPGSELKIASGSKLMFHRSVGMMIHGKLSIKNSNPNEFVKFSLFGNANSEILSDQIRLVQGKTGLEGRLEVKVAGKWGSVCNYGWTITNAALVCRQLGYILNPNDWLLEPSEMPSVNILSPVLSNIRCSELDTDLIQCKAEKSADFMGSCASENNVGIRCYEQGWAGVHKALLSSNDDLENIEISHAGLFDPMLNKLKPAVLIDLFSSTLKNFYIHDNIGDGIGIYFSSPHSNKKLQNLLIQDNKGNGIVTRSQGIHVENSRIQNNSASGFHYNPLIQFQEERDIISRLDTSNNNKAYLVNDNFKTYFLRDKEGLFLLTSQKPNMTATVTINTDQNTVFNIIIIGDIHPHSTEEIGVNDWKFNVTAEPISFPLVTYGSTVRLMFNSGVKPLGNAVLYVVAIERKSWPLSLNILISKSTFSENLQGISVFHYNRYKNEWNDRYLRVKNESVQLYYCTLRNNHKESFSVVTPLRESSMFYIGNITYVINNTIIENNGDGISQISFDIRNSNNKYHWILGNNLFSNNKRNGIHITLPYVWHRDNSNPHSLFLQNNTFISNKEFGFHIDGYFAKLFIINNNFINNICQIGLMDILGMEKEMQIYQNKITENNCQFMVEFNINSHTDLEGFVFAEFKNNEIRNNLCNTKGCVTDNYQPNNYVIALKGIQNVNITNNIFDKNQLQYELLAGIRTSSLNNVINVKENWWGQKLSEKIRQRIFDFDDWNSFAIAEFSPFLLEPHIGSGTGEEKRNDSYINLNNLGGRLTFDLNLRYRREPYVIKSDLTIMPGATLIIDPGVKLEFYPSVGILVLGTLKAFGSRDARISMRPVTNFPSYASLYNGRYKRSIMRSVRLCSSYDNKPNCDNKNEGFVEIYNATIKQWIPLCDEQFTERNAEIICSELGYSKLNVYVKFGPRLDIDPTYLSRIRTWLEPRQCSGQEKQFLDCDFRLNSDIKDVQVCSQLDSFVFIHCGKLNLNNQYYWGGIRFSSPNFEEKISYPYDKVFGTVHIHDSVLEYVDIIGAGILHNEKSAAIYSIFNAPKHVEYLNVTSSASHGINIIAPSTGIFIHDSKFHNNLGIGLIILVLNGDSGDRNDSTFMPLTNAFLSYNAFGMIEMCESHKILEIEERVLLYFKYYNHPIDCVKIFTSTQKIKNVGLRFLQFNLFKSSNSHPDSIRIYDGNIYNNSSKLIGNIEVQSENKKTFFKGGSTLSVHLHASGAMDRHGFIAEIITLPALFMGSGRSTNFNVSYSVFSANQMGGIMYGAAGEDNPIPSFYQNQIKYNGLKMFGNFTSSTAAVILDIRNTITFNFQNNFLYKNQGGLQITTESSSSAIGLNAFIQYNLFAENYDNNVICIKGKDVAIQIAYIKHNLITLNSAMYEKNIYIEMSKLEFFDNYIYNNTGQQTLTVFGYEKMRLQSYQQVQKNAFHDNIATWPEFKGTIFAGGAGQSYENNVLMNPLNDFEIVARNRTFLNTIDNRIDATNNWWGSNYTSAISGRIRDKKDFEELLEVVFEPFYMNNLSLVDGKCPPGWTGIGATCFIYIGGVMTLEEGKSYCKSIDASMPYLRETNQEDIRKFIAQNQQNKDSDYKVWILSIDFPAKYCVAISKHHITDIQCEERFPVLCERNPDIYLEFITDTITIASLSAAAAALLLVITCIAFWICKSRRRNQERLERQNSIRASKRSIRSLSVGTLASDINSSKRMLVDQPKSIKMVDVPYKGSFDSLDKSPSRFDTSSYFNSSIEDNQSYEICEATNHKIEFSDFDDKFETESHPGNRTTQSHIIHPSFHYGYDNKGFLDNAFAKDESQQWGSSSGTESTVDMKRYLETSLDTNGRDETYTSRSTPSTFSQELPIRRQLLETDM